jgi:hypothetical protein
MAKVNIVVKGWMGVGKSAIGNVLSGQNHNSPGACKVAARTTSVTQFTSSQTTRFAQRRYVIYDTPGEGETSDKETERRYQEITMLKHAEYINAIVLVFNWNQRLDVGKQVMLQKYVAMFQRPIWNNVCVVLTGIDAQRRDELGREDPDGIKDYVADVLRAMGPEGVTAPYYVIDPFPRGRDPESEADVARLLHWAGQLPPLEMNLLECPDAFYKNVDVNVTQTETVLVVQEGTKWSLPFKIAGGILVAGGAIAGAVIAAPLVMAGAAAAAGTVGAAGIPVFLGGVTAAAGTATTVAAGGSAVAVGLGAGAIGGAVHGDKVAGRKVRVRVETVTVTTRTPFQGEPHITTDVSIVEQERQEPL